MNIRPATANDVPAIMEIAAESSSAARWSRQQYEDLFASEQRTRSLFILALVGEHPLGFLIARCVAPEWELENIVVVESARRNGIGKRLLVTLVNVARETDSDSVILEVRESNLAARALYERAGFLQGGRRKSYYSNPIEDAILYRLTLR